jgi:hypothetical protein
VNLDLKFEISNRRYGGTGARPGAPGLVPPYVLLLLSVFSGGCGHSTTTNGNTTVTAPVTTAQDHFSLAMGFFRRSDEFDPFQGRKQVLDNLGRWIEDQPADEKWQPDALVARMPSPWRDLDPLKKLGRHEFGSDEIDTLNEAAWARDIARWVSAGPLDPWLEKRLPGEDEGLAKSEIERLAVALRLFDWTTRNIQLDELLPIPKTAVAGPSADPTRPNERPPPPPFQAVPGPGYRHFPWQAMLMGHGDAWERARIFILLCRQEGIDAVMLGTVEGAPTSPPKPWLPAVFIKDRLFLLDTGLGLPLPGPGGKGIATLAQVVADAKLLRKLDKDAENPYPVSAEALTQVVALVDAPPATLSRRMGLVEARLSGDDRMALTVSPSQLKERLGKTPGVSGVQIWILPLETMVFRAAYMQLIRQDQTALVAFFREEGPFQTRNPLVLARLQHFRGVFDAADQRDRESSQDETAENSGRERPSARSYYLAARIPDEDIRKFETSEEMQRAQGLIKMEHETVEAWNDRRKATIDGMRNMRHNAAFWLGLTHYERQSYETAIDWFQRRTLDVAPEAPCAPGARYNVARAHEALGDLSSARVIYYADESPQRHGNRLRAEWLDD